MGNIDGDDDVDVWSISTRERVIDGVTVSAWMPYQHLDDLK